MTGSTLKTVVHIQVGYQAKTKIQERKRGTHRLIQGKDFNSLHRLRVENLTPFFPERKPEIYSVRRGDVLFQARGKVHFAYCIEDDLKDTLAAGSFYILRLRHENLLPKYLAWWLNQSKAQAYFQSQAHGAGISFIPKSTLSRLQVQIPPLFVQKKVLKMVKLAEREQFLLERLSQLRLCLVKTACIKAVKSEKCRV